MMGLINLRGTKSQTLHREIIAMYCKQKQANMLQCHYAKVSHIKQPGVYDCQNNYEPSLALI